MPDVTTIKQLGVTRLNGGVPKIRDACGERIPYFRYLFANCVNPDDNNRQVDLNKKCPAGLYGIRRAYGTWVSLSIMVYQRPCCSIRLR